MVSYSYFGHAVSDESALDSTVVFWCVGEHGI